MEIVTQHSSQSPADILIVDDTIANLQLLSDLLKAEGYRVRAVTEGRLALSAASKKTPDLILLDINMPEMDGLEVCRRLKTDEQLAEVPVIFISALNETADKVKALSVGGVDYITKPFQFDEVRARVDTHVKVRSLQNQLQRQNRELRVKNRQLQELSSVAENLTRLIVHDLRAPLGGVMGYLELLQINSVGQLDAEVRGDIDRALTVAGQMSEMVNSLLDISRLEDASMPIHSLHCELGELADEAVTSLESLADHRHLNTALDEAGVYAHCDPKLIRRVIVNLLHNALKCTSRNGRITVSVGARDGQAIVKVVDDGPGIADAVLDKVFDKFSLPDLRNRSQGALPGLGLAFCKLCVEAHGGNIGVESGAGEGSMFWFSLPLAEAS